MYRLQGQRDFIHMPVDFICTAHLEHTPSKADGLVGGARVSGVLILRAHPLSSDQSVPHDWAS